MVDTGRTIEDFSSFSATDPTSEPSADIVVPMVVEAMRPESVLDVGCGAGKWLQAFQRHRVAEVHGVDDNYAIEHLVVERSRFTVADLTQPLDLGRRFDLVVSLEVAEHLPVSAASTFVATLVRHGEVVLFSAASPGQVGRGHVNLQWPSYWCALFEEAGYRGVDLFRGRLWDDDRVAWYYRQNMVLFGTASALSRLGVPDLPVRDLAHPALAQGLIRRLDIANQRSIRSHVRRRMQAALRRRRSWSTTSNQPHASRSSEAQDSSIVT